MKCSHCQKEIPNDATYCCYCGVETGKYIKKSKYESDPFCFGCSYTIESYKWMDKYLYTDYNPARGVNEDELSWISRTNYKSFRCIKTYQSKLVMSSNIDRIELILIDNYMEASKVFIAKDIDWLELELSQFGKDVLSKVIDYSIKLYRDGFEWTLEEYHGGRMLGPDWDRCLYKAFYRIHRNVFTGDLPIITSPRDYPKYSRNNQSLSHVRQLWTIPGDLQFEIKTLTDRSGKQYECPFINGHALSRKLKQVLFEQFHVDMTHSGTIPRSFFDKYVLSEVFDDKDSYITSDLWYTVSSYAPLLDEDIIDPPE